MTVNARCDGGNDKELAIQEMTRREVQVQRGEGEEFSDRWRPTRRGGDQQKIKLPVWQLPFTAVCLD
jgi:hypothetical protein